MGKKKIKMKAMASSPEPKSPTPPPALRRRTGSSCSSSFSSASFSSFYSSIRSTPSPSHYFVQTPFHSSSSSIPFSWEQTPGIPKKPSKSLKPHPILHLPLPPPLRSDSFTRRGGGMKKLAADVKIADVDPFAAALAECAKDPPPEAESEAWIGSRPALETKNPRRFSICDRFGLGRLDLYGSCKTACSVARSTIEIPRVSQQRFGLGRLDLYGSCKTACSVARSTIEIPRVSQQRFGPYRVLNRRVG